jgi:purine-binding chemotaxis protein CheW
MPVHETTAPPEQQTSMVTFRLGSQVYALPIAPVRQIIEMVAITPLPQVNQTVLGVINYHGSLAPVINMRRLIGLPDAPLGLHTPIILAEISQRLVGLIVDEVSDVVSRPSSQVIPPAKILLDEMGQVPILQGLIQDEAGSILLLNPENLLKVDTVHTILEAALQSTQGSPAATPDGQVNPAPPAPSQGREPGIGAETPAASPPVEKPVKRSHHKKPPADSPNPTEAAA